MIWDFPVAIWRYKKYINYCNKLNTASEISGFLKKQKNVLWFISSIISNIIGNGVYLLGYKNMCY